MTPSISKLTPKQRQVCFMIVSGKRSKEIARDLDISHRTVDDHRSKIFTTMGVRNAVELTLAVYGFGEQAK